MSEQRMIGVVLAGVMILAGVVILAAGGDGGGGRKAAIGATLPASGPTGHGYAIYDAQMEEGSSGTKVLKFAVIRPSDPKISSLRAASLPFHTEPLPNTDDLVSDLGRITAATAGADYEATSGGAYWEQGSSIGYAKVTIKGDTALELDERFLVELDTDLVSDGAAVGTIVNDDPGTGLFVDDVSVQEGDSATVPASFRIRRTAPTTGTSTVKWATANGTATAGSDYVAGGDTVTFAPGETQKTVTVNVLGELVKEDAETFEVRLSTPTGGIILDSTGVGTIGLSDWTQGVAISDASLTEGNSGNRNATFTIRRHGVVSSAASVQWSTADIPASSGGGGTNAAINGDGVPTEGPAAAGSDYSAATGTVTFAAGDANASKTVTVEVNGDVAVEPTETFNVVLSSPVDTEIVTREDTGVGTIVNDEVALWIGDGWSEEGSSGTRAQAFVITRTGPTTSWTQVNWETINGTAVQGSDLAGNYGNVYFAPGENTKLVSVDVTGDTTPEVDETFTVKLSEPVGGIIAHATGRAVIADDDGPSVRDIAVAEGNSGTTDATFTIRLAGPAVTPVAVGWATANGSALAGSDFTAASGTVRFDAGQVAQTVTVKIVGDTAPEPNETLQLKLDDVVGAATVDGSALGRILDDETTRLSIDNITVTEGNAGTSLARFTITRSGPVSGTSTVNWSTPAAPSGPGGAVTNGFTFDGDGPATAGTDYGVASDTATFGPNVRTQTVTVPIIGDTTLEPNEYFDVSLVNPTGAVINTNDKGRCMILSDD
jgi:hypothetical protein